MIGVHGSDFDKQEKSLGCSLDTTTVDNKHKSNDSLLCFAVTLLVVDLTIYKTNLPDKSTVLGRQRLLKRAMPSMRVVSSFEVM